MTDYHWVYLLDEQFRVNRLSEQKNVSPDMVPKGARCSASSCRCGATKLWERATTRSISWRFAT